MDTARLKQLIPAVESSFSTADLYEIADAMTKPAVKKYIKSELAKLLVADLQSFPEKGESDADFIRKKCGLAGSAAVWTALLNIESPSVSS